MSLRPMLLASLCLVAMFATVTDSIAADPSTPGWIDVRSAINRGLPKTAIEKLQPIITSARQAGRYDEAIRAIGLKIALESNVHGNRADERITRLQAEIAKAPEAMKPVFNAILANWYWNYFQQNRWQFMQRTQTAGPPGDDLTTWDLSQILAKIDKQFQITLSQSDKLQQIPIAKFDALFDKGTAPDAYRPTLYDVLVYNALDFYSAGEQAGGRQIDSFDVRTDSPVFSPVDDFLRWKPDTTDTDSPTFQAIRLYQDLLSFHANDDDRSALMDANLARLIFANNVAKGSDKTDRFHAALRRFAKENDDHPIAARALYQLALGIYFQKDRVKAREIAQTGLTKFPQSVGGKQCDQLIQQIDARHANVSAERVWNRPGQNIQIEYRNITAFHFRLVPFDFAKMLGENRNSPERLATAQREALLARKSVKTWSVTLPQTKDYQERIEWIETPDDIPPGGYYLIASHDPGFVKENNVVSFSQIWVTELALITRNETNTGIVDGFVLDAQSGEPIAGAAVRAWTTSRRSGQPIEIPATKTNANGIFQFKSSNNRTLIIHASHDGQQIATANLISSYINDRTRVSQQTQFFTDRSIYRPGQTIRYKGICMSVDHKRDSYHTLAGREVTVRFLDVNNKEVETQTHRTNDYGSFSGSVTAPRDRLMGRMRIQVQNGPPGQTQFRVEEYKRPKFRVEVKPPTEAAKLGGIVKVQGVASSYTGAAINDAKVTYRIVRGAEYPVWWWRRCWWMPPTGSSVQEIDHGTATTAADGTFDIQFDAKPDL